MKHPYLRFASITALATITAAACVYEAGFARADDGATVGVTRIELHRLPAPTHVRTTMPSTHVIPLGQPLVAPR